MIKYRLSGFGCAMIWMLVFTGCGQSINSAMNSDAYSTNSNSSSNYTLSETIASTDESAAKPESDHENRTDGDAVVDRNTEAGSSSGTNRESGPDNKSGAEENNLGNVSDTGRLVRIENSELAGFWHSSPVYGYGSGKSYHFFKNGIVYFYENNTEIYEGNWSILDSGKLEITVYNSTAHTFDLDFIPVDAETGNPVVSIDTEKYWKMNKPTAVIKDKPLIINLDYNLESTDYQHRKQINIRDNGDYQDQVIIYSDTELYDVTIYQVYYDFVVDMYYAADVIFSTDQLTPDSYLNFPTYIPEMISIEAVTFTDENGTIHSYVLSYNGRDGSTCTNETEVQFTQTWRSAYANLLLWESTGSLFSLADIDGDETPELLVGGPSTDMDKYAEYNVYSFSGNRVNHIGSVTALNSGSMWIDHQGGIICYDYGAGSGEAIRSYLNHGVLRDDGEIYGYYFENGEQVKWFRGPDGSQIPVTEETKDEYERILSSHTELNMHERSVEMVEAVIYE